MSEVFDFPVSISPITLKDRNLDIPNKFAVVRTDTNETLSIVSDKYQMVEHKKVVDNFRKVMSEHEHTEKIKIGKGGAKLFITYDLPNISIEVSKDDFVSLQFVVKNSYDGSSAVNIMLGAFRLVCENGMVLGKSLFSYSQKHIGENGNGNLKLAEKIEQMTGSFKDVLPSLRRMNESFANPKNPDELFNKNKVSLPEYILSQAKKEYIENDYKSVWDYYNSLTSAITHSMRTESQDRYLGFSTVAWKTARKMIGN